ncbi:LysR family transcriptional regulator ArgP [Thalassotalea fusca]
MRELDYKLLRALHTVMLEGSFEKAANKLSITQSAVSQRIKQLEQQFAEPVLLRTQPMSLTPLGSNLLTHFQQVNQLESDLLTDLFPHENKGPLSVAIALNADSVAGWFIPAVSSLLEPLNIELDLQIADESLTQERLKNGEVYAAVSSQSKSSSAYRVRPLGTLKYFLGASPQFIAKHFPNGVTSEALRKAPTMDFNQYDQLQSNFLQTNFGISRGEYPCHRIRSVEAMTQMVLHNCCYALLPEFLVEKELASGAIINILPKNTFDHRLYWHSWTLEKGRLKTLSQHIVDYAHTHLLQTDH